ncbi:electron transfer flavoprotein subunit beta/FixA family protein [Serinicoccus kebangsaanensis]|uniref:electron transfer flavoprotein subunit beta/FixA family protein n=1 Tax=Serinicoccus kebangsaanensis TaxID=2602069 RepID=UPI00124EF632|nr:electron transfer flavoprotein subunit beta/FixA family protein [Serinicoccus kebangsaanensis]
MTDVLVCVKRVPDTSGEVVLTADGDAVDGRYAGWTMSAHEECAVEIAAGVAGDSGGSVTVLTLGDEDSVEQLRAALAVGAGEAVRIDARADDYGPADVAGAIAEVARAREAAGQGFGLILVGNDAADTGDHQVGIRLAHLLGRPVVAGAQEVTAADDRLEVRVGTASGTEVYDVPMPAVLTVLEGGVEPRYPNISGRMKAKKAQIEVVEPGVAPQGSGRLGLRVLPPPESNVEVLGEGAAAAPSLVAVLREIGVVR